MYCIIVYVDVEVLLASFWGYLHQLGMQFDSQVNTFQSQILIVWHLKTSLKNNGFSLPHFLQKCKRFRVNECQCLETEFVRSSRRLISFYSSWELGCQTIARIFRQWRIEVMALFSDKWTNFSFSLCSWRNISLILL